MAVRTVVGRVTFSDEDTPSVGARVVAELFDGDSPASFLPSGDLPIGRIATLTARNGEWALNLEPNELISPAGTVWRLTITPQDGATTELFIEVPDSDGPHDVSDILAEQPGAVASQALASHAALSTAHGSNGAVVGRSDVGSIFQRPSLVDVRDYGATPGGGSDATSSIQSAVDAAVAGDVVTGAGLSYLVSSVVLKSDLTFERFSLLTKPGSTAFVSPVTVGAYNSDTVRRNINIRHVHVNGQRAQQTSIGAAEDGGRHGFRLIGHIEDLTMSDCSATYCASDGLCIFSGSGVTRTAGTGVKQRLVMERCSFTYNRRHGVSIDSLENATFRDCTFSYNGIDVGGSEGELGDTLLGSVYGNGVDVEEYDVDTYEANITFERCVSVGNARAAVLFYSGPNRADDNDWVTRSRFTFSDCYLAAGSDAGGGGYAVEITPKAELKSLGWYYTGVVFLGGHLDGALSLRSVRSAALIGLSINAAGTHAGNLDTVESVRVVGCDLSGKSFFGGGDALTTVATS